ncbi:hypothetical protein ACMFMG_007798 [Clarireedia jacksonii]
MGIDGHAIHVFHGHTVYMHSQFIGDYIAYYRVPNAWGFLMFCAGWTVLLAIFHLIAGNRFTDRALIGYIRVGAEAVAVLSWLAGMIAVAVQIGTDTCLGGDNKSSCGVLTAATVFAAVEWLLFMATAALTAMLVFSRARKPKTSETKLDADI